MTQTTTEHALTTALIAMNERQHMLINQLLMLHNATLTTIMADKPPGQPAAEAEQWDSSQSAHQTARHSAQIWALQADLERAQATIKEKSERIDALLKIFQDKDAEIASCRDTIERIEQKIDQRDQKISTLERNVDGHLTTIEALHAEIAKWQAEAEKAAQHDAILDQFLRKRVKVSFRHSKIASEIPISGTVYGFEGKGTLKLLDVSEIGLIVDIDEQVEGPYSHLVSPSAPASITEPDKLASKLTADLTEVMAERDELRRILGDIRSLGLDAYYGRNDFLQLLKTVPFVINFSDPGGSLNNRSFIGMATDITVFGTEPHHTTGWRGGVHSVSLTLERKPGT